MLVPNTRFKTGPYIGTEQVRREVFPVASYNYTLAGININRPFQPPLQDQLLPVMDLIPRNDRSTGLHNLPQLPLDSIEKPEEVATDASTEVEDISLRNSDSEENQSCQNCNTTTTPLWRRDGEGTVLCNACGLFLKLHGRARPISLKRDTIKHRNRKKKKLPRKKITSEKERDILAPSTTSSTSITPKPYTFAKIAPLPSLRQGYGNTSLPIRNSSSPCNRISDSRTKPRTLLDRDLQKEEFVIKLKTRVSELESLTQLYRGHIVQLEKRCSMLETKLDSRTPPK